MSGMQVSAADVEWIAKRTAQMTPAEGNTIAVLFKLDGMEVVEVAENGERRASWGGSPYGRTEQQ